MLLRRRATRAGKGFPKAPVCSDEPSKFVHLKLTGQLTGQLTGALTDRLTGHKLVGTNLRYHHQCKRGVFQIAFSDFQSPILGSIAHKLRALKGQVDLGGVFAKIGPLINLNGPVLEFPENRRT